MVRNPRFHRNRYTRDETSPTNPATQNFIPSAHNFRNQADHHTSIQVHTKTTNHPTIITNMNFYVYPSTPSTRFQNFNNDLDVVTSLHPKLGITSPRSTTKKQYSTSTNGVVRVQEHPDKYTFSLDVPGIKQNDLTIELEENGPNEKVLHVRGTRKWKHDGSEQTVERRAILGDDVDVDKIGAHVEDGVLEVVLLKKAKEEVNKPTTRSIPILSNCQK